MSKTRRIPTRVVLALICVGAGQMIFAEDGTPSGGETQPAGTRSPAMAFALRSMYLLHLPLLDFGAVEPGAVAPGTFECALSSVYATSYSTTWHARRVHADPTRRGTPFSREEADYIHAAFPQDAVLFVDGEALRTSVSGRFGLTPSLSISVEVPYVSRGLTGLESAVLKFHKAFGVPENGRDEFPKGRATVMLQSPGGPLSLTDFEPASGLGDVTATLAWRRPRSSGGWTFGADLAAKAPTGSAADLNGSGGWDGGFLAFAVWEGGRWTLEADGSVVVPGQWKTAVPVDPAVVGRMLVSAIYGFSARTRAGFSVTAAQSPYRSLKDDSLSEAGVEAGLGVEHDFGSRWTARLMFTEQLPTAGDRSDFGLMLGLRYR